VDRGALKVIGNVTILHNKYDFLLGLIVNYVPILCRFRDIVKYLSKFADFNLSQLHLSSPLVRRRKTGVSGLSCGIVFEVLRLAVSAEHQLVANTQTDRQTDTRQLIPR